jgi:pRiA4b ORF-3-like protein
MKSRPSLQAVPSTSTSSTSDAPVVVQIKVWLIGISPMVWRRVLVPTAYTLQDLHGVLQIAMGWEGIHLYQFTLRATRYGSLELATSSPDVTLAALRLRKGARFLYEYDLNIPWRHEVRLEDWVTPAPEAAYPCCIGGSGDCPPEDCGGPATFMARRDDLLSLEVLDDLAVMAEVIGTVAVNRRIDALDDEETRWRLERAVTRSEARLRWEGRPFSRRAVNARLRQGEHRVVMHQQC